MLSQLPLLEKGILGFKIVGSQDHPLSAIAGVPVDTRKLFIITIEYDEIGKLPLRWVLHVDGDKEAFLKAKGSFRTREEAFRDAERLLQRLKKRYARAT